VLRREISAGAQEWGKDTHKRTRTRAGRSGFRLRARGEQEAPTRQGSHAATSAAQRSSAATDQDAFQPPVSTPPPNQGGRGRGGRGRGGTVGPQPQGPMHPQPFGMPGLLQPQGSADPVQRQALMMALMVLGMPPVYSCHIPTGCGSPLGADMSEPKVCPPIEPGTGIGISAMKEERDARQWTRLPAVHCVAMQSSLSFMCGLDGRARKVRYEKFRQPCGVQPTAC
jgi:hypothetical protein